MSSGSGGVDLLYFARSLLADPDRFAKQWVNPMLLWRSPTILGEFDPVPTTGSGRRRPRPENGETMVFELKKRNHPKNPFSMGVTVGRVDSNDIALDDHSVSRFHAYFQQVKNQWLLCDAESKNGTVLAGVKLTANEKVPLLDHAAIRFGDVNVTWLNPAAFRRHVQALIDGTSGATPPPIKTGSPSPGQAHPVPKTGPQGSKR